MMEHNFLIVSEAGSSRSTCQLIWLPVITGISWLADDCLLSVSSSRRDEEREKEREREPSGVLSCKNTNTIMKPLPYDLI